MGTHARAMSIGFGRANSCGQGEARDYCVDGCDVGATCSAVRGAGRHTDGRGHPTERALVKQSAAAESRQAKGSKLVQAVSFFQSRQSFNPR